MVTDNKVSVGEFFARFIPLKRNAEKSKGVHSVYSGANNTLCAYYEITGTKEERTKQVIALVNEAEAKGEIEVRPARGGVMIFLPGEAYKISPKADQTLADMGL